MCESLNAHAFWLFKHADEGWLDLKRLQEVDLLFGLGEAIEDPPVNSAVCLLEALLDQGTNMLVRYTNAFIDTLLYGFTSGGASGNLMLQESAGAHINKTESLTNCLSLSGAARPRWSQKNDSRRSSRPTALELDSKHAGDIVGNIGLGAPLRVVVVDKVIEG